jgi:DNA modification methylase
MRKKLRKVLWDCHNAVKTIVGTYEPGNQYITPEDIIETLIANSCPAGGVVFDPFSGSGTTCARAKKLGRHYLGMEINEGFWKSSRRRVGDTTADTFEEQMTLF